MRFLSGEMFVLSLNRARDIKRDCEGILNTIAHDLCPILNNSRTDFSIHFSNNTKCIDKHGHSIIEHHRKCYCLPYIPYFFKGQNQSGSGGAGQGDKKEDKVCL